LLAVRQTGSPKARPKPTGCEAVAFGFQGDCVAQIWFMNVAMLQGGARWPRVVRVVQSGAGCRRTFRTQSDRMKLLPAYGMHISYF